MGTVTAINCLLQPDAAYLFSDGAVYDRDGVVVAVTSKVTVCASASMALLASGRAVAADYVATQLFAYAVDFDHLRATIAGRLPALVESATEIFGEDEGDAVGRLRAVGQGLELIVAGWSQRAGLPEAFAISTAPRSGRAPFEPRDAGGSGFMTPALHDEDWRAVGGMEQCPPDSLENLALLILEMQRQKPEHGRYSVGGLAELVTIRRDRVECRILKRWAEDRIGEKMAPKPVDWPRFRREHPVWTPAPAMGSPVVPFPSAAAASGLTRQQRRAAARLRG